MTDDRRFVHTGLPSRVVFGQGTLPTLSDEVDRLGLGRVVVVCTPGQEELGTQVSKLLGNRSIGAYPRAVMHVPAHVADHAVAHAKDVNADGLVAVGGGSAVGLAKVMALHTGLPLVAVPTTYAGSEMTPVWGLTDDDGKRTGRDIGVLPASVVYDVDLTLRLPLDVSITSAVNAMAHAVEAIYAPDGSPVIDLMARESISTIYRGIDAIAQDAADGAARSNLLYGAWLAGCCLGATTMSLHHKLCHILGGTFNLDHAWTHTVILPHVMAFNLRTGSRPYALVADAIGDDDPGNALWKQLSDQGRMRTLEQLGMPRDGIKAAVRQAVASPYANPVPVAAGDIREILGQAWSGNTPRVQ